MTSAAEPDPGQRLTPRERECLRLVHQHFSSKAIARRLGLSRHTIDDHVDKARRKLGAADRFEAARMLAGLERTLPSVSGPGPFGMVEAAPVTPASPHAEADPPPSETLDADRVPAPDAPAIAAPRNRSRRNTLSIPARVATILGIAAVAALAFGALLAGVRALQDIAVALTG